MAISSIHIEGGKIGFFAHNDRTRKTKNSIFDDEHIFYSCSAQDAIGNFKVELEKRTAAYLKNHPTRTKLHSKTLTHLSAIVNFNKEHTPADIAKVCKYLEKEFDTKVIQFAMHRDEGHINEQGEKIKNYHAHIEFMGLDSNGNSIRRKLDKKSLIELQSMTARLLQMERGANYAKEQKPRPKRLNTYDFKAMKEAESKAVLATQKQLKEEIAKLRAELQENKAKRADYGALEALNNKLKEEIKDKSLTIEDLSNKLREYQDGVVQKKLLWAEAGLEEAKEETNKYFKAFEEAHKAKNKALEATKTLQDELDTAKNDLTALKALKMTLTTENDELKSFKSEYELKITDLKDEISKSGLKYTFTNPFQAVKDFLKWGKSLLEKVKLLEKENEELKTDVSSLTKQKSEATKQVQLLENENEELKAQLLEKQEDKKSFTESLSKIDASLERIATIQKPKIDDDDDDEYFRPRW